MSKGACAVQENPRPPAIRRDVVRRTLPAIPIPDHAAVREARSWLTARFAAGVDLFVWETDNRPMDDGQAVMAVIRAASSGTGQVDALDAAAALISLAAMRAAVDDMEAALCDAARSLSMDWDAIGAIVGISASDAENRYRIMQARSRQIGADGRPEHGSQTIEVSA
jgi:hypothetical protein